MARSPNKAGKEEGETSRMSRRPRRVAGQASATDEVGRKAASLAIGKGEAFGVVGDGDAVAEVVVGVGGLPEEGIYAGE